jgi:tetratricopeptide (TPR) repeat protein
MTGVPDALQAIADRLETERAAARPIIDSLRTRLDAAWEVVLPESWRTLGFVQELTSTAASVLEQDPAHSWALAQFALAVATAVPQRDYPPIVIAQVEGHAWKELGTAHRYLSSYDAALRAYEAGRVCFGQFGALANDEASIDLAIAIVLSEVGRQDEALALIAQATAVFSSFGDDKRVVHGGLLKAMIHHRNGDLRAARTAYEDALVSAEHGDDLHSLAAIHSNLGQVLVDLNETGAAATALGLARELFAGLQMPAEVARTEGALAQLCVHNHAYDDALTLLLRVRTQFLQLGMVHEAGVAALNIVDVLLATSKPDEAQQLTATVLAEFRAAGLNERALLALEYLREILHEHHRPGAATRHVRSYLEALRTEPARVFLPLPE